MDLVDREKSDQSNIFKGVLDQENVCGHTPFFVAVVKGHLEMAELLLCDEMSDLNHQDEMEDTPLHWAVLLNNPPIVKFLLQKGANRQLVSKFYRNNPVMTACLNSKVEMLQILLTPKQSIATQEEDQRN